MPRTEREAILRRVAKIESEILGQQAMWINPTANEVIAA